MTQSWSRTGKWTSLLSRSSFTASNHVWRVILTQWADNNDDKLRTNHVICDGIMTNFVMPLWIIKHCAISLTGCTTDVSINILK